MDRVFLLIIAILFLCLPAFADTETISFAGKEFVVPIPEDCIVLDKAPTSLTDLLPFRASSINLKQFWPRQDHANLSSRYLSGYHTAFVVEGDLRSEYRSIDMEKMSEYRREYLKQHLEYFERDFEDLDEKELKESLVEALESDSSTMLINHLGFFDSLPRSISFLMIVKTNLNPGLEPTVVAATSLLVKGKLLWIYAVRVYRRRGDLETVKKDISDWRDKIDKLNRGSALSAAIKRDIAKDNKVSKPPVENKEPRLLFAILLSCLLIVLALLVAVIVFSKMAQKRSGS